MYHVVQTAYLVATALFIFSLHWMSDPKTARRGVYAGVSAMMVAVLATWAGPTITHHFWILIPVLVAVVPGVWLSRVSLTAVPQRTALSHAFGGLAAGLVGMAKFYYWHGHEREMLTAFRVSAIVAEVLLGFVTLTGSLLAAAKLQEVKWISQRPITFKFQNYLSLGVLGFAITLGVLVAIWPDGSWAGVGLFFIMIAALVFGVLLVLPIGGADMPTVISILNAYAGLSAVAMGFVLDNKLLITAGALDGSSGLILSIIMCRAMNRSFANVLFGAFGQVQAAAVIGEQKAVKSATSRDAAQLLENAQLVVVIPGYGMAVAQAQHRVRELYDQLTKRGVDVRFAIHPVAGRMPGHMNVLLAEAEIPYDKLVEMDEINHDLPQADVALVIGANDVVNPSARHDKSSPIYGMPIIDADKAKTCLAIKRSMKPGFAGIDNELYTADNTLMVFGDAKAVVSDLVKELSGQGGGH